MWMGTKVFILIIASFLVILLCFPSRMKVKARHFSLLVKVGFTLGLLVFLLSFSIGPPPICKEETPEELLLRRRASCLANGGNESSASSSSSSSSRNNSIPSQAAIGCVHKEKLSTMYDVYETKNTEEMCTELIIPTGFCSIAAEEQTIYGRARPGVVFPADVDAVQTPACLLLEQIKKWKNTGHICPPGEFATRDNGCRPSSLQEALDSKECFNDLTLWPDEAMDLVFQAFQTMVFDGFFEFCDPGGTQIVPHCASKMCHALEKVTALHSSCEDGVGSVELSGKGESDAKNLANNFDIFVDQFQGPTRPFKS
jgi:hypothetical protein